MILAVLLYGCSESTEQPDGSPGSSTSPAVPATAVSTSGLARTSIDVVKPWSVDVLQEDDRTLIASLSHSEDFLAVWAVDDKRQSEQLAREPSGFHPDNIIWFDWNGDGEMTELLLTVEGEKQVQLWELGFWGLKKIGTVIVEDAPQNVRAADLDQDGKIDLVLGPYEKNRLTVLWGQGDFSFEETHLEAWPIPAYPKLVDWDGDGDTDIVWSEWEHHAVRWADNLGGRQFELIELATVAGAAPRQADVADVDGDGHPDLIVSLEVGGAARILYGNGSGGVRGTEDIPAPVIGYSDAAVGRDRDGQLLALSETDSIVLARRVDGDWQLRQLPAFDLKMDLQLVDIDRDGEIDLIYAETSGEHVQIVYGPLWSQAEALP